MTRFMTRLIGIVVLLTLGVFIGMEITSTGIERIYGPLNPTHVASEPKSASRYSSANPFRDHTRMDDRLMTDKSSQSDYGRMVDNHRTSMTSADKILGRNKEYRGSSVNTRTIETRNDNPWLPPPVKDAPVNQLADKTAGMLQQVSQASIRAVVGLFNGLF